MLSGKYLHVIDCDMCDGEDVVIAMIIGEQNCDQTIFRNKINMMKINRLDLKAISDAIQVLDSTRDTLFRRKIKLEDIEHDKDSKLLAEVQKVVERLGVDNERI